MPEKRSLVMLSQLDLERFGVITAKTSSTTSENISETLKFCEENGVELLIARCSTNDLKTCHAMEKQGFLLMDTLVYYSRDLTKNPIPADTGKAAIRLSKPADANAVEEVARDSFKGYFGHYHADERLDRSACDAVYTSWARNSINQLELANAVLVAEWQGEVAGFATLRENTPQEGEGVLFGISPAAQGQGIYRSFIVQAMNWSLARGHQRIVVSTQITNVAVQKVWIRTGFEMSHSYYTFHKWFDHTA